MVDKSEKGVIIFLSIVLFIFGAVYIVSKDLFFLILHEDNLAENITAAVFLVCSLRFFLIFLKLRKNVQLVFSLFMLVVFLEEISYGQRIFGYKTPLFLSKINVQNEVNIHNIGFFDSGLVFYLIITVYFIAVPLFNKNRLKTFFKDIGLIVPSVCFFPFWIVVMVLCSLNRPLSSGSSFPMGELAELIISLMFYFTVSNYSTSPTQNMNQDK